MRARKQKSREPDGSQGRRRRCPARLGIADRQNAVAWVTVACICSTPPIAIRLVTRTVSRAVACVLDACNPLASKLFTIFGLDAYDRYQVDTQEQVIAGSQPDMRIDGRTTGGALQARLWCEYKLDRGRLSRPCRGDPRPLVAGAA